MRKPTKSSLKRKLDIEVSRIVRSQGKCCKCSEESFSQLQCAHIFSRNQLSVRWSLMNVLCLCAKCHFWSHQNPVLFTEFVKQYLGDLNYETLKQHARAIKKWDLQEMQELLEIYQAIK